MNHCNFKTGDDCNSKGKSICNKKCNECTPKYKRKLQNKIWHTKKRNKIIVERKSKGIFNRLSGGTIDSCNVLAKNICDKNCKDCNSDIRYKLGKKWKNHVKPKTEEEKSEISKKRSQYYRKNKNWLVPIIRERNNINRNQINNARRKREKYHKNELTDHYIVDLLREKGIKKEDITEDIIILKRCELKLKRAFEKLGV